MEGPLWLTVAWQMLDGSMRKWSEQLQKVVRLLRLARAALVVAILLVLFSAFVLLVWPEWFPIAYAVAVVVLVLPLVLLTVLIALPLRARSVVRLVDMGYPANAKELAIRLMARKLHEQSIETEELLVETAINEGRKVLRRMRRAGAEAAGADPNGPASPPPPPPPPPAGGYDPPGAPPRN